MVDYSITKNGAAVLAENDDSYILGVVYEMDNDEEVNFYDICGKRNMHKGSWTLKEAKERLNELEAEVKNASGMIWG